jgi:hypothetical protein
MIYKENGEEVCDVVDCIIDLFEKELNPKKKDIIYNLLMNMGESIEITTRQKESSKFLIWQRNESG